jgi:glycosyltransferase involved in cell wall biosynthesis
MKILICPFNWWHQTTAGWSGGEVYLFRLCEFLLSQGHELKMIAGNSEYYEHQTIPVYPQGEAREIWNDHNDLFSWCDVVLTHLLGTAYGYNKANQHKKPLLFIAHNNSKSYPVKFCSEGSLNVIYNSYQLRDDLFSTLGHQNSTVLHPLLPDLKRTNSGKHITLINCNFNKGGDIFIEIAKRLPNYQFLGVFGGYGDQITGELNNISYLPNGSDMDAIYSDTRLLLVLSEFESFSQVAMEAMICGIPIIASPTSGLQENLSSTGIFISRLDIDKIVQTIVYLIENETVYKKQSDICYDRGLCIRDKSESEKIKFNDWVNKIR